MLSADDRSVAERYVAHRTLVWNDDMVLRKKESSNDAEGAVYDLVRSQPTLAWEVMREIARLSSADDLLMAVANGPLNQLLREHAAILDAIEQDAQTDVAVRRLLSHVWDDDSMVDGVLMQRIRRASGEFDEPSVA